MELSVATHKATARPRTDMAEDASLEDFVDAGRETGGESAATDDDGDAEVTGEGDGESAGESAAEGASPAADAATGDGAGEERVDPGAVDPAAATYEWAPGGAPCAACGDVVERRWRGEAGLVCGSCKAW